MASLSTPRPISREQFQSLRQQMVKESPKLYKSRVLSDPGQQAASLSRDKSIHVGDILPTADDGLQKELREEEKVLRENEEMTEELGNFENPVLGKLAKRTVNKEYETHTIAVNLIALAIWDLFIKFYKLFIGYTRYGETLMNYLQYTLLKSRIMDWRTYLHRNYPFVVNWLNSSNVDTLFHLIVVYNVVVSLWKLFSKVKVDDLNLTQSQRELLGLENSSGPGITQGNVIIPRSSKITKPHVILDPRNRNKNTESSVNTTSTSVANTPYLFKSLETPLKRKQKEQQEQSKQGSQPISLQRHTQSAFVSRVNAFGNLRNNVANESNLGAVQTPERRMGYIPSNKYAYMVNSPCPRKKM